MEEGAGLGEAWEVVMEVGYGGEVDLGGRGRGGGGGFTVEHEDFEPGGWCGHDG